MAGSSMSMVLFMTMNLQQEVRGKQSRGSSDRTMYPVFRALVDNITASYYQFMAHSGFWACWKRWPQGYVWNLIQLNFGTRVSRMDDNQITLMSLKFQHFGEIESSAFEKNYDWLFRTTECLTSRLGNWIRRFKLWSFRYNIIASGITS